MPSIWPSANLSWYPKFVALPCLKYSSRGMKNLAGLEYGAQTEIRWVTSWGYHSASLYATDPPLWSWAFSFTQTLLRIILLPVMAPNKDLRRPELSSQLSQIIGRSFMAVESWRLWGNRWSVLILRMNFQLRSWVLRALTVPPKPMRSGQTTRKSNSNSIGIWYLQPMERSGQPWSFASWSTYRNYSHT